MDYHINAYQIIMHIIVIVSKPVRHTPIKIKQIIIAQITHNKIQYYFRIQ